MSKFCVLLCGGQNLIFLSLRGLLLYYLKDKICTTIDICTFFYKLIRLLLYLNISLRQFERDLAQISRHVFEYLSSSKTSWVQAWLENEFWRIKNWVRVRVLLPWVEPNSEFSNKARIELKPPSKTQFSNKARIKLKPPSKTRWFNNLQTIFSKGSNRTEQVT